MDKIQKLKYQKSVESYLEQKKVYDLFERLLCSLVVNQPNNPIDFLIEKISKPEVKRIFMVGPPGSSCREIALQLASHYNYTCISVADLLKKEVTKKTPEGQKIEAALKSFKYADDELVIPLVKKAIEENEKQHKNVILEGFPKTRVQGLAFQKVGINPTSFIVLNVSDPKLRLGCLAKIGTGDGFHPDVKANKTSCAESFEMEYKLNIAQTKEIYQNQFFQVDAEAKKDEILNDIERLLKYKIKKSSQRSAIRIIVMGPPGSGRSTLVKQISKNYGLVYISTEEILKDQIAKKTKLGNIAFGLLEKGEMVPDEIIIGLLNSRINQTDCLLQGYVVDGFPKNKKQIDSLQELNIHPNFVIILEVDDRTCKERLSSRKLDPVTGVFYNAAQIHALKDDEILKRITSSPNEAPEKVSNRIQRWRTLQSLAEKAFQGLIFKVDASAPAKSVYENVSFHMEKSL